ncbi:GNAT family N-acetyltransferase [Flagellimonas olearia]|uniref:GNAT family N-acetyltransferase n=1 Tax=Flagellimonas olearia TaxID=552546 RepID=A0A6I1DY81_9FLAO|nr:GNAT family N-acetyltransferase [Allomuricauda olearia]KAB7529074.1 GNAT family N-acetyltransferase [Allomuricauda olearia]
MNTTVLNIENLTQLWSIAGETFHGHKNHEGIHTSTIENSQWPNRIWTDAVLSEKSLQKIKAQMERNKGMTFSHFNLNSTKNSSIAEAGFSLKSLQYGMSLSLEGKFETQKSIEFVRVTQDLEAETWSSTFYRAFHYRISPETPLKTASKIPYFLVYYKKQLVGTVIMYTTGKTLGVHALGIDPEQRKQGYATEIMHHVLNKGIDQGASMATLQASEMAKNMYLKMGFTHDFLMENYQLKTQNI